MLCSAEVGGWQDFMGNSEETLFFFFPPHSIFIFLSHTGQLQLVSPFTHPPPSLYFHRELESDPPSPPLLWFSNVAGLCTLLCLEPLEHTVRAQTVARAGVRAHRLSLPLLHSPALTAPWLFQCLVTVSCPGLGFH